jgi:hypothetical protein
MDGRMKTGLDICVMGVTLWGGIAQGFPYTATITDQLCFPI